MIPTAVNVSSKINPAFLDPTMEHIWSPSGYFFYGKCHYYAKLTAIQSLHRPSRPGKQVDKDNGKKQST